MPQDWPFMVPLRRSKLYALANRAKVLATSNRHMPTRLLNTWIELTACKT